MHRPETPSSRSTEKMATTAAASRWSSGKQAAAAVQRTTRSGWRWKAATSNWVLLSWGSCPSCARRLRARGLAGSSVRNPPKP